MIVVGALVLFLLASFILTVIVFLLQLLAVIIGIVLVLGGIAAFVLGPRWWRRRSWDWGSQPQST